MRTANATKRSKCIQPPKEAGPAINPNSQRTTKIMITVSNIINLLSLKNRLERFVKIVYEIRMPED